MKSAQKKKNILDYVEYFEDRKSDNDTAYEIMRYLKETAKKEGIRNADELAKNRINELEDRCVRQEFKLQNCIPFHIIIYLVINAIVVAVAMVLLVLRFAYNLYSIDPYYLICALGIGTTLFMTAVVSLKEWKGFLNSR